MRARIYHPVSDVLGIGFLSPSSFFHFSFLFTVFFRTAPHRWPDGKGNFSVCTYISQKKVNPHCSPPFSPLFLCFPPLPALTNIFQKGLLPNLPLLSTFFEAIPNENPLPHCQSLDHSWGWLAGACTPFFFFPSFWLQKGVFIYNAPHDNIPL